MDRNGGELDGDKGIQGEAGGAPGARREEETTGEEGAQGRERGRSEGDEVRFTGRRLEVMSHLWEHGSGTVAEVRKGLPGDPGYTTVLKMLQVLEDQGYVRHEAEGRAYRYYPTVGPEEEARGHLAAVVDKIFHGSAALTLAQLLSSRRIPADELDEMRALLDRLDPEELEPNEDEGPSQAPPQEES